MRVTRPLLVALVGVGLSACSLLLSTDGFDDGETDGGALAPDGGARADDSGANGGSDAASPFDATSEASARPFCDDAALFCTDLEDSDGIARFSEQTTEPGTTIVVEAGESRSPSRAVRVTTSRRQNVSETVVRAFLPQVWRGVRIRFAFRVEPPAFQSGDRGTHFFNFAVQHPSGIVNAAMELLPNRTISFFTTNNAEPFTPLPQLLTYDAWHAFDIEMGLTTNTLQVKVDDAPALAKSDMTYPSATTVGFVVVMLGAMSFNTPHPGVTFRFDDVRVDPL